MQSGVANELERILNESDLQVLFQTIVSLQTGLAIGFDAAVRGPSGSPLYAASLLIGAAERGGRLADLERLALRRVLEDVQLVEGIARDPQRQTWLGGLSAALRQDGILCVAEGIESVVELRCLNALGLEYGQGLLVARPISRPSNTPSAEAQRAIAPPQSTGCPHRPGDQPLGDSLILRQVAPVSPDASNADVFARFKMDTALEMVPVVTEGVPVGMITRAAVIDHFARPYRAELDGKKPCRLLMGRDALIVDHAIPETDFIGHVGGDDFILVFRRSDWRACCVDALAHFDREVLRFFSPDDIERGGYIADNRKGVPEFHPLTCLSIGAVSIAGQAVGPSQANSPLAISRLAAVAKKQAKAMTGSALVWLGEDAG